MLLFSCSDIHLKSTPMKAKLACISAFALIFQGHAQTINKEYNNTKPIPLNSTYEINAHNNSVMILVDVIYNAVPDGYVLTYTTTFTGNTIDQVEAKANQRIDDLIAAIRPFNIQPNDVTVDLISLDPIFDFRQNDSLLPQAYKITQNLSINIKEINLIGKLTKKCLDFGIYDLINVQTYILNTDAIQDSLDLKSVEILNQKKKLCEDVGVKLTNGTVQFNNYKEVFYPSEKYLKSYINNATYFNHHSSQNSSIHMQRKVDVDNYYDFNLKNADYVFHSDNDEPVIQFYTQITYSYNKVDTEAEMREKIRKEEEKKPTKEFYILNKEGNLTKIGVD